MNGEMIRIEIVRADGTKTLFGADAQAWLDACDRAVFFQITHDLPFPAFDWVETPNPPDDGTKYLVLRKEGGIQTYYKGWKMIVHAHSLEQAAKSEREYRARYPKTATAIVPTCGKPFTTVAGEVDTGWTQVEYREVPA